MSSQCGLVVILITIAVLFILNGCAKEIRRVERGPLRLNEYISHYETLSYDDKHLHASHSRAKRSVTKDHHVYLRFKAHGKDFHLRLKRDLTTFSDKLEVHSTDGPVPVDTSHIYHGDVIGDRNSHVFGSIINGVFEGKIITERDVYYVEHAKHYFPSNRTIDQDDFHSIIYNEKHVEDPYRDVREGHVGGCGINEQVSRWMQNIQNSAVEEPDVPEVLPKPMSNDEEIPKSKQYKNHPPKKYQAIDMEFTHPHEKYTKEANIHEGAGGAAAESVAGASSSSSARMTTAEMAAVVDDSHRGMLDEDWHRESHERVRRASTPRPREDNKKNTCSLYIQTDPLIWRHVKDGIVDNDRGSKRNEIDEKTREEILSLIAHHVTAVNYIYRNTKFDGRIEHRNIRFEVQRIKIDDDSACKTAYNGPHNAFCNEHMDVSNFLNLHSLEDHGDFCLAYVFTYRDFTGGTLGLAWVASASGASGGICEKYKTYTETVGGQYQSTKRSLNTGIITFVNYNSRVPPKVSQLTLAHEIGHNFGSPHDYPQECRPGGVNGNFIMFASATSGDRPNNSKFSQCSIRNISNVLDALVGNPKRDCFKASEGAFCGNKIVESGEECDCGFNEDECKDKCCYPRLISEYDMSLNSSATGCTRRARTQCSPSQGPCCLSDSCTFVPAHYHMRCKEETECSWSSTCNGTTPECPEPKPRDDKTKCNNGTQLCIKGDCSGSICLLWNMNECFLTSQNTPHVDKRKLCELACQNGTDTGTCRSTSEFAHVFNLPVGGISLRPGSPCDNFQGYCDVFLKCRAVDAEGPLVRLKNLLLNKETLSTLKQWVTDNWYLVVLIGIAFIIVMGIFIKCCAVHTPSSNPKKRAAIRLSDTLRGPMTTLRRMRNPSHNRGAGPRSIPPPGHERSRSGGQDWDRRNPDRGGGAAAAGAGGGRRPRNGGNPGRPANNSRSAGPHNGYGDGRGQHYPPKAVGPPVNYNSRPTSLNNPELYAEAYTGRGAYDVLTPQPRVPNSKV